MKNTILMLVVLCQTAAANSFVVEGTNVIRVTFQDSSLSTAQQSWIGADILRIVLPGLIRASLVGETNSVPLTMRLQKLYTQPDLLGSHGLNRKISVSGTNLTMVIEKTYTDSYLARTPFFTTHSNAIVQAFAFTESLITNPAALRTDAEINDIYLTKSYAPGTIPASEIAELRVGNLSAGTIFPPSLQSFQVLPYGPGGGNYLWCFPPLRRDLGVYRESFIYYNGKWWMTTWLDEEGAGSAQQW